MKKVYPSEYAYVNLRRRYVWFVWHRCICCDKLVRFEKMWIYNHDDELCQDCGGTTYDSAMRKILDIEIWMPMWIRLKYDSVNKPRPEPPPPPPRPPSPPPIRIISESHVIPFRRNRKK